MADTPKIPKSVRIIGKDYAIEPVKDTSLGAENWGMVRHMEQKISYLVDQAPQQIRDTILHEIIHAIEYSVKLDLEEREVHALSSGLCQVLWDNQELAKWLIRK